MAATPQWHPRTRARDWQSSHIAVPQLSPARAQHKAHSTHWVPSIIVTIWVCAASPWSPFLIFKSFLSQSVLDGITTDTHKTVRKGIDCP